MYPSTGDGAEPPVVKLKPTEVGFAVTFPVVGAETLKVTDTV
jgi:hypothetical protein